MVAHDGKRARSGDWSFTRSDLLEKPSFFSQWLILFALRSLERETLAPSLGALKSLFPIGRLQHFVARVCFCLEFLCNVLLKQQDILVYLAPLTCPAARFTSHNFVSINFSRCCSTVQTVARQEGLFRAVLWSAGWGVCICRILSTWSPICQICCVRHYLPMLRQKSQEKKDIPVQFIYSFSLAFPLP